MAEGDEAQNVAPGGGSQASNNQLQDTGSAGGAAGGGGLGAGGAAGGAAGAGNGGNGGGRQTFSQWLTTPPSESLAGSGAIILTSIFLITLTVALLISIAVTWPECNYTPRVNANESADRSANSNVATGANVNSNSNAANTNTNTNTNTNANATANTNTTANTNVNANTASGAASPPAPSTSPLTSPPPNAPTPDVDVMEPKSGSVLGNTPVTIRGKNLLPKEGLTVKFDDDEVKPDKVTETSISVKTPKHSEGDVDVSVLRNGKVQDTLAEKFTYVCAAPQGSTLFLLLIMAGALGGCIHALRSLWWYTGDGSLKWKWLLMYFCVPFTGAAMAMLFGLLIVAGVIENTSGRNMSLFIIAIAGLVGMFTQQAALKLTDIANAVFTRPGEGKDAKTQPSLPPGGAAGTGVVTVKVNPPAGPAAGGQPVSITGTGLTDVASVTFGASNAPGFTLDAATGSVNGVTPQSPTRAPGDVDVTVTNAAGKSVKTRYTYT
jgi:hypothetical protein